MGDAVIPRHKLNVRLTIERPTAGIGFSRAGKQVWAPVRKVWAEVQDILPSRAERQTDGFTTTTWRARVRMDHRADITADMRFVGRGRTMQIVSGPARVESLNAIEFMVEEYSPVTSK